MPFYPSHRLSIKYTHGNELMRRNAQFYVGNYIETRDGKYYAGVSPTKLGIELVKPEKSDLPFGKTRNVKMFNILNQTKYNKLKKYQRVIPTKTFPKPKDYEKGEMEREEPILSQEKMEDIEKSIQVNLIQIVQNEEKSIIQE